MLYEPFYIGKGHGKRLYAHLKAALGSKGYDNDASNKKKIYKINKIIKEVGSPYIIKVVDDLEESDALRIEEKLINAIGTYKTSGPLTNVRDSTWVVDKKRLNSTSRRKFSRPSMKKMITPDGYHCYVSIQNISWALENGYKLADRFTRGKNKDQRKARLGNINGMYGKSVIKGRKWVVIDGESKLLTADEINEIERSGGSFTYGRIVALNKRTRIIVKGESKARYVEDEASLPEGTIYQYGLVWSSSKTTHISRGNNGIQ